MPVSPTGSQPEAQQRRGQMPAGAGYVVGVVAQSEK